MDLIKHEGRYYLCIPVLRDDGTTIFVTHVPHNPIVRTRTADEPWWSRGHASQIDDRQCPCGHPPRLPRLVQSIPGKIAYAAPSDLPPGSNVINRP